MSFNVFDSQRQFVTICSQLIDAHSKHVISVLRMILLSTDAFACVLAKALMPMHLCLAWQVRKLFKDGEEVNL